MSATVATPRRPLVVVNVHLASTGGPSTTRSAAACASAAVDAAREAE
jgi:hypothetical protein